MNDVIKPGDAQWPTALNELSPHVPPKCLYVRGLPLDPNALAVAVVGTRRPSAAGIEAASAISQGLAEAGFTVVSGLAVGIDAVAHRAALDAGGHTVAVLGCGLDVCYPQRNAKVKERIAEHGTLLTEYRDKTPPVRHHFPARNRIIAALCAGVVVIEGALTSGALVTARLALDANRNVYAVPGSIRNPMAKGPNELIRTGRAALVTSVQDIFDDLAPGLVYCGPDSGCAPAPLDEAETQVLSSLDDIPVAPDVILGALDMMPGSLSLILARLEVRGLATRTPGGYALTTAGARALSVLCRR